MTLEILTPESKIFSGDVYGVQLPGISGLFSSCWTNMLPMVKCFKDGKTEIPEETQTCRRFL